ncbi:MAG: transposase [Chloroflexi bacterium]|nr:transposase [Chloroflexota bacterium]
MASRPRRYRAPRNRLSTLAPRAWCELPGLPAWFSCCYNQSGAARLPPPKGLRPSGWSGRLRLPGETEVGPGGDRSTADEPRAVDLLIGYGTAAGGWQVESYWDWWRLHRLEEDGVMREHSSHPSQRRYPPELKDRAVRLVFETAAERGDHHGAVTIVAHQLGIGPESLRTWVRQSEIDAGRRAGLTTEERERMKVLERENRELRRANEILKSAAAFFGAELDRRSPR